MGHANVGCCHGSRFADRTEGTPRHHLPQTSHNRCPRCTPIRFSTPKLPALLVTICILLLSHMVLAYPQLDRRKTDGTLAMPLAIDYSQPPVVRAASTSIVDGASSAPLLNRKRQYNHGDLEQRSPDNGGGIITAGTQSDSTPRAFDTNMGDNYTDPNCDGFFNRMLADPRFINCLPVSLLLQTSNSFFQDTKSIVKLTSVLDKACAVDLDACSAVMDSYAGEILTSGGCEQDYQLRNPTVEQALNGLLAYVPIHEATCRKDNDTNNYCYAEAVSNMKNPTTSYVYYLPLGVPLPSGAMPQCNECMQQTLAGFADYASNSTQPISRTYPNAAQQFDVVCGPTFARKNILVTSGAMAVLSPSWLSGLVALAVWWLSVA